MAIVVAVIVIAVVAGVSAVAVKSYRSRTTSRAAINSIAVMPFLNESGNADVEYLSDGMTETLIGSLSQLPNLNVKARSTVFRYKGKTTDAKTIGQELNVQAILNGRVIQHGDQLMVSLELVNAETENVIWSDRYNRKQADLVSLQSDIARDVSSKLRSKLSGEDESALNKKYTDDAEAYRLYLQGRFYLNKRVGKEYEKAEGFLRQAIGRDPNFALGYIGLAEFFGQRDRQKAKELITRALAIDNQLSEAHAILGLQFTLDRDWVSAERELTRAIELDPNNGRAHKWNGDRQVMIGRYDECVHSYDRAIAIDSASADLYSGRGVCFVAAGRIDEGIASIKTGMQIDPGFPWCFSHISFVYRMKGDRPASVEARAHAIELLDRPDLAKRLRDAFAGGWSNYLHELLAQTKDNFNSPTRRASILAELGQKEEALAALDEAAAAGDFWLLSTKYDPAFDPLRSDPRFQKILTQFNPPR
jgi:TolB-like protein/Tfp pilus assembly protein PilF